MLRIFGTILTLNRLIQEAGENRSGHEAKKTLERILGSFDFTSLLQSPKSEFPRGRWDAVAAEPGVTPAVLGSCRPPGQWSNETFDLNRRAIAELIVGLQSPTE